MLQLSETSIMYQDTLHAVFSQAWSWFVQTCYKKNSVFVDYSAHIYKYTKTFCAPATQYVTPQKPLNLFFCNQYIYCSSSLRLGKKTKLNRITLNPCHILLSSTACSVERACIWSRVWSTTMLFSVSLSNCCVQWTDSCENLVHEVPRWRLMCKEVRDTSKYISA